MTQAEVESFSKRAERPSALPYRSGLNPAQSGAGFTLNLGPDDFDFQEYGFL